MNAFYDGIQTRATSAGDDVLNAALGFARVGSYGIVAQIIVVMAVQNEINAVFFEYGLPM